MAEAVVEDDIEIPSLLLPCVVCNRTFRPEALVKHTKVCQKSVVKRKVFDSSKQRIQGTDIGEFLPVLPFTKKPEKSPVRKTQSKWKEKHTELVHTIRAARCEPGGDASAPAKPSDHEKCPHCERFFGPKAFDRHLEWCKEQRIRIQPKSPASLQAKERLEARTKYRAPLLNKSRRTLTKEKYLPHSKIREPLPAGIKTASSPNITSSPPASQRNNVKESVSLHSSNFTRGTSTRGSKRISSPTKKTSPSPRSNEPPISNIRNNTATYSSGKNKAYDDKTDLFTGSCNITAIKPSENINKTKLATSSRKNSTRPRPCYSNFPCGNSTKLNDLDVNLLVPDITVTACILYNHETRLKDSISTDESTSSIVLNKTYTKNSEFYISDLFDNEMITNEDGFSINSSSELETTDVSYNNDFDYCNNLCNDREVNISRISNLTDNDNVENNLKENILELDKGCDIVGDESKSNESDLYCDAENKLLVVNNISSDSGLFNINGEKVVDIKKSIECEVFTSSPVSKHNSKEKLNNFDSYFENENFNIFHDTNCVLNDQEDLFLTTCSSKDNITSGPLPRKRMRLNEKSNLHFTDERDNKYKTVLEKNVIPCLNNVNYLDNKSDYAEDQTVTEIEGKQNNILNVVQNSEEIDKTSSKHEDKLSDLDSKGMELHKAHDKTIGQGVFLTQFKDIEVANDELKTDLLINAEHYHCTQNNKGEYINHYKLAENINIRKEVEEGSNKFKLQVSTQAKQHNLLIQNKEGKDIEEKSYECEIQLSQDPLTHNPFIQKKEFNVEEPVSQEKDEGILCTNCEKGFGETNKNVNLDVNGSSNIKIMTNVDRANNKHISNECISRFSQPNLTLEDLNTHFVKNDSNLKQTDCEIEYIFPNKDTYETSNNNYDYKSFHNNENEDNCADHQYEFHSEENVYNESSRSQCWKYQSVNKCSMGGYTQLDCQSSYVEQCHMINNRIIQSHSTFVNHGKHSKSFDGNQLVLPMIKQNYKKFGEQAASIVTFDRNKSRIPQSCRSMVKKVIHLPPITQNPTSTKTTRTKSKNINLPPLSRNNQLNDLKIINYQNNRTTSDEEKLNAEQELLKSLSEYKNLFKSDSPIISSSLESLKLFPSLGCSSHQDQLDNSGEEKGYSRNETNKSGPDSAYNSLNRKSPLNETVNTESGTRSSSESEGSLPLSQNSAARFCHECGNRYPVSAAKFCCNCGVRRLVI